MLRTTERSTEHSPLVFGVQTAVWIVAAKKAGKWHRWVFEAAELFMSKWRKDEANLGRQHHAPVVGGAERNGRRRGTPLLRAVVV